MSLVVTMLSEKEEILGFLILGRKKSALRFSFEDVDLLNTIGVQAGLAIERIMLQQRLLLEHEESKRLEDLSRLKSYFVSSVSHDLKTPLTSIRMFAEMLRSGRKFSRKRTKEYLEIIEGESERLSRLINNVLDFAKIERGVMEYHFSEVRLNELLRGILRSLDYQFRMEGFDVRTKFAGTDPILHADPDAVTEAVMNLVSNAMKYSQKNKSIKVSTFRKNHFAGVRVEDRGIGIAGEELKTIFQPFVRGKNESARQVGGAGLGLSLVKYIVDAHGGRIEVVSTPGKGSSFTVLLPLQSSEDRRGRGNRRER
jgi:signal transduction histidine kinase